MKKNMMADVRGKGIAKLYDNGGAALLAHRLAQLFTEIETPADIALHNDVMREVLEMVNTEPPGDKVTMAEMSFVRRIADYLLYRELTEKELKAMGANKRKRFLFRMAQYVIEVSGRKG